MRQNNKIVPKVMSSDFNQNAYKKCINNRKNFGAKTDPKTNANSSKKFKKNFSIFCFIISEYFFWSWQGEAFWVLCYIRGNSSEGLVKKKVVLRNVGTSPSRVLKCHVNRILAFRLNQDQPNNKPRFLSDQVLPRGSSAYSFLFQFTRNIREIIHFHYFISFYTCVEWKKCCQLIVCHWKHVF